MGTPNFAVPSLEKLQQSTHEIIGVVTPPDRPRGRGQKVFPCAVKQRSLELGLVVFQPENISDSVFVKQMQDISPDLIVVVAFQILPPELFTIPKFGTFNLHSSLLPAYRGAAPIHRTIINGETETGVTTFFIDKKVDTGAILLQDKTQIYSNDTLETLHDRLSKIGSKTVLDTANALSERTLTPIPQNESKASRAPKITSKTCCIRWNRSAKEIRNRIRGLSPVPGAFTFWRDMRVKIFFAEFIQCNKTLSVGEWFSDRKRWVVQAGDGALELIEVQVSGKRKMTGEEALRGLRFDVKQKFSNKID